MSTKKNMAMFLLMLFCMVCIAGCGSNVSDEAMVNQTDTADPAGQATEESIKGDEIPVILSVDGKDIPAVIYDTTAGRSVIAGLPYTVHLSKGATDFCGDIGVSFEYEQSDIQDGVKKGDLVYWIPGDDLTIFFDEFPPTGTDDSELVSIGRILNGADADFIINYEGNSLDIAFRLAEE